MTAMSPVGAIAPAPRAMSNAPSAHPPRRNVIPIQIARARMAAGLYQLSRERPGLTTLVPKEMMGEQNTKLMPNAQESHPLLFAIGAAKPTTRDIARTIKEGGTSALTDAERRADEARYQE